MYPTSKLKDIDIVDICSDDNMIPIKKEKQDPEFTGIIDNEKVNSASVSIPVIENTKSQPQKSQSLEESEIELSANVKIKNKNKIKNKIKKKNKNKDNKTVKNDNESEEHVFKAPEPITKKKSQETIRKLNGGYESEGGKMYNLCVINTTDGTQLYKRSPKWDEKLNLKVIGYPEFMRYNNTQFKSFSQSYVIY